MKGIRKNGFKGVAVAAALSMTMTTMVSPAATAIPTGRWEQSMPDQEPGNTEVLQVNMPQTSGFLKTGKWYRFDKSTEI